MIEQQIKEHAIAFLEPILAQENAYLVDFIIRREGKRYVLTALLDTDTGVSIEQCARISRQLGLQLESQNVIDASYRLEVSSPGIDQPLRMLRQFPKVINRDFLVTRMSGTAKESFTGKLKEVRGTLLVFENAVGGDTMELEYDSVLEVREKLPW